MSIFRGLTRVHETFPRSVLVFNRIEIFAQTDSFFKHYTFLPCFCFAINPDSGSVILLKFPCDLDSIEPVMRTSRDELISSGLVDS